MESLENIDSAKPRKPLIFMFIPVLVAIAIGIVLMNFYERERPQLSLLTDITRVGVSKECELVFTDGKSGLRSVEIRLVQGAKELEVYRNTYPRQGFLHNSGPEKIREIVKLNTVKGKFKDGEAQLMVSVRDYSWWDMMNGNETTMTYPLILDTRPPLLNIIDSPRYIIPGGAGIVIYKVGEEVERHGVTINGYFHPGFPLPQKGEGVYGAIIAVEYNAARIEKATVDATDLAGNLAAKPFGMIMRKAAIKRDRINVSDGFLEGKLPEFDHYYPELVGKEPLEQYLEINNRIRNENGDKIREICSKSRPEMLWEGRFQRMARSSRRAGFAEYRTYYYNGQEVDQQVHLGIDLASTQQAEVFASNRGVIVFADYLGIYGNMVIIDHGLGVFTLYSHLSQISGAVGDMVTTETVIGLSGNTGMAGGDHLHYSVLINGVFVNPLEWWDPQWLKLNILSFL
ncbi:MAG: M23 family metallopeptidase [Proteobacteria bacterium]|nr:M23 family metallopeptidase [Pseudomonadota bacterium]MBU1736596.1 M23 family metallopeptidase [Pseudomonadota bacterium]